MQNTRGGENVYFVMQDTEGEKLMYSCTKS